MRLPLSRVAIKVSMRYHNPRSAAARACWLNNYCLVLFYMFVDFREFISFLVYCYVVRICCLCSGLLAEDLALAWRVEEGLEARGLKHNTQIHI